MSNINWKEVMKWSDEQLDDLRFTGYSYIRQGKFDIAISFFEALIILDKDSSYDTQTLGALYLQMNQPDKAIPLLQRSLKLEGDHAPTLLNLAKAFFMTGKVQEGLKLATILKKENNPSVSNMAKALLLAYS